ncbi:FHA domain-containing protein [Sulfitobacter albidus]|uniref:FHA domain-containing protein n=1 Tax=Sulfitobacter albidus TaxID=2829501 RepID=A0A975PNV3_9RHOB|nr:FHA domain-containing protein [Sulfitobacter albidus]
MKTLTLSIENHATLENGGPVFLTLSGKGAQVGRKAGNDWVLPDPSRHISGHHFDIVFERGQYLLIDVSSNGTFLQGERYRIDGALVLEAGHRLTVGHYIIGVQIEESAPAPAPAPPPEDEFDDVWGSLIRRSPVRQPTCRREAVSHRRRACNRRPPMRPRATTAPVHNSLIMAGRAERSRRCPPLRRQVCGSQVTRCAIGRPSRCRLATHPTPRLNRHPSVARCLRHSTRRPAIRSRRPIPTVLARGTVSANRQRRNLRPSPRITQCCAGSCRAPASRMRPR